MNYNYAIIKYLAKDGITELVEPMSKIFCSHKEAVEYVKGLPTEEGGYQLYYRIEKRKISLKKGE